MCPALPFEIILRLASVLGRNDPISFVMRLTRTYNRANDAMRRLSDEEFAKVLAFTNAAFELALSFGNRQGS